MALQSAAGVRHREAQIQAVIKDLKASGAIPEARWEDMALREAQRTVRKAWLQPRASSGDLTVSYRRLIRLIVPEGILDADLLEQILRHVPGFHRPFRGRSVERRIIP
jgi:hypothetical protein